MRSVNISLVPFVLFFSLVSYAVGSDLSYQNAQQDSDAEASKEVQAQPSKSLAQRLLEGRIGELKAELEEAEQELAQMLGGEAPNSEASSTVSSDESGALVVVSGDLSSGSGFIASIQQRTFFVTNIHVLGAARGAELTTVDGEHVELTSTAFVSKRRDLAIVPIDWDGPVFEISTSLNFDKVEIGEAVTVMGNSSGANVATRLEGEIRGLGPDEIEVSANFVPGNSGSPIVHNDLGTVIGIAAYLRDFRSDSKWTEGTKFNGIRRFGYRLDGDVEWQQVALKDLYRQGEAFAMFEDRTKVMWNVSYQLRYESTLMTNYRDHDSLGHLYRDISRDFNWGRGTASAHNSQILARFINQMMNESQSDISETEDELEVEFYKRNFNRIVGYRQTVRKNLTDFSERRL